MKEGQSLGAGREIIGRKIVGCETIAREIIGPFRKDVLAKLYGGDVTRKPCVRKLFAGKGK